jgi:hypothetical protein
MFIRDRYRVRWDIIINTTVRYKSSFHTHFPQTTPTSGLSGHFIQYDVCDYWHCITYYIVNNYVLSNRKLSSTLACQKSFMSCKMKLSCCMTWNFYVRRANKKVCCRTTWNFHVTRQKIFWHPSLLVSFLLLNT